MGRITEYNRSGFQNVNLSVSGSSDGVADALRGIAKSAENVSDALRIAANASENIQANSYLQDSYAQLVQLRTATQAQYADNPREAPRVFAEQTSILVNKTAEQIKDRGIRAAYVKNAAVLAKKMGFEMIDWGEKKFGQNTLIALEKGNSLLVQQAFSADPNALAGAIQGLKDTMFSKAMAGGLLGVDPDERDKVFLENAQNAVRAHISALLDLNPALAVKELSEDRFLAYTDSPAGVVKITPEENTRWMKQAKANLLNVEEQRKIKDALQIATAGTEVAEMIGRESMTVSELQSKKQAVLLDNRLDEGAKTRFLELITRQEQAIVKANQADSPPDPGREAMWATQLTELGLKSKFVKAGTKNVFNVAVTKGRIKQEIGAGGKKSATLYRLLDMMADITDDYTSGRISQESYKSLHSTVIPMLIAAERKGIPKSVPEDYRLGLLKLETRSGNLPAKFSEDDRSRIRSEAYIAFSELVNAAQKNGVTLSPGVVNQMVQAAWTGVMRRNDPSFISYKKGDTFVDDLGRKHKIEHVDPNTGDIRVNSAVILNQGRK